LHDWASNPADAMRYLAICAQETQTKSEPEEDATPKEQNIMSIINNIRKGYAD
jgi:hypothetical protein